MQKARCKGQTSAATRDERRVGLIVAIALVAEAQSVLVGLDVTVCCRCLLSPLLFAVAAYCRRCCLLSRSSSRLLFRSFSFSRYLLGYSARTPITPWFLVALRSLEFLNTQHSQLKPRGVLKAEERSRLTARVESQRVLNVVCS